MNMDEREEHNPPLSILQRLDRLERLVLSKEEKHCYTTDYSAVAIDKCLKSEEQCKSLSSALEEVHHKGTLLDRVTLQENRLIQLSIDLDLGKTSRSSSTTSAVTEKLGHGSQSLEASGLNEDMKMVTTLQEKQGPLITQDSIVVEACSVNSPSCRPQRRPIKAMSRMGYNWKWLKGLKMGCCSFAT